MSIIKFPQSVMIFSFMEYEARVWCTTLTLSLFELILCLSSMESYTLTYAINKTTQIKSDEPNCKAIQGECVCVYVRYPLSLCTQGDGNDIEIYTNIL